MPSLADTSSLIQVGMFPKSAASTDALHALSTRGTEGSSLVSLAIDDHFRARWLVRMSRRVMEWWYFVLRLCVSDSTKASVLSVLARVGLGFIVVLSLLLCVLSLGSFVQHSWQIFPKFIDCYRCGACKCNRNCRNDDCHSSSSYTSLCPSPPHRNRSPFYSSFAILLSLPSSSPLVSKSTPNLHRLAFLALHVKLRLILLITLSRYHHSSPNPHLITPNLHRLAPSARHPNGALVFNHRVANVTLNFRRPSQKQNQQNQQHSGEARGEDSLYSANGSTLSWLYTTATGYGNTYGSNKYSDHQSSGPRARAKKAPTYGICSWSLGGYSPFDYSLFSGDFLLFIAFLLSFFFFVNYVIVVYSTSFVRLVMCNCCVNAAQTLQKCCATAA
jgi:hypothetical protein